MQLLRTLSTLSRDSAIFAESLRHGGDDPAADLQFRIAEAADDLHALLIEEAVGRVVENADAP